MAVSVAAARAVFAIWRRFRPLIAIVAAMWLTHLINVSLGGALTERLGLAPRRVDGLDGVVAMPFLHGSWEHLSANTAPLLTLGGVILTLAPRRFWTATAICVVVGGMLTWMLARAHLHIGASGLVFGWFGFLVALGLMERSWPAVIGAGVAVLMHGASTILGLMPTDSSVSWDGHLAGLAAGVAAAWLLKRPPVEQRRLRRARR